MRPPTRTSLLLAVLAAVVALPTVAAGALPSAASAPAFAQTVAANSQTYPDSTGENPAAPDITSIVVSNNDARMLSFQVNIANRPQLTQDIVLLLWVDSDNNAQTGASVDSGDPPGTDYVIELVRGEISLYRWDGTGFTRRFGDPSAVTLSYSWRNGPTVRISASELGNTKRLRFYTLVISGIAVDDQGTLYCPTLPATPCPFDDAPGGSAGLFSYQVKITPATLVAKRFTQAPAKPAAGKSFTLRLVAARSDSGAVIQDGRVTCVGRAGNARLKAQIARVVAGAATCTWNLPPTTSGKTFRGSVTVRFEGLGLTQAYAGKIR